MQFISCHNGRLLTSLRSEQIAPEKTFVTGLTALDELAPGGRFMRGAIHELLVDPSEGLPQFIALIFAREFHPVIWCDPSGELYPPAIAPFIPLAHLYLLHPKNLADETWAVAECLRCKGVAAVIAAPSKLSRIEARRLQLAAERGGGVGILLRRFDRSSNIYAAATRWLVAPFPSGDASVQKWAIQLIHGHGGRVGTTVILEHHRETNLVRATDELVDRSVSATPAIRASA